MLFHVLAFSAFLVTVHGQTANPTIVCFPDWLQIEIISIERNITGLLVADFPQQLIAARYSDGTRYVANLDDHSVAIINDIDGSCKKIESSAAVAEISSQCLPADAKPLPLTADRIYLGVTPDRLRVLGWELTLPDFGIARILVTQSFPNIPILAHTITTDPAYSDLQLFYNSTVFIDDPTILNIPDNCTIVV